MYLTLRDSTGVILVALLLRATHDRLNVILRNCEDASEFRLIGGHWISEGGQPVEIEAILADTVASVAIVRSGERPLRTAAAS